MNRPSAEIDGSRDCEFACLPALDTLTRSVVPFRRSRTKTSYRQGFVSCATRLEEEEKKATKRPSAEIAGDQDLPFPVSRRSTR